MLKAHTYHFYKNIFSGSLIKINEQLNMGCLYIYLERRLDLKNKVRFTFFLHQGKNIFARD